MTNQHLDASYILESAVLFLRQKMLVTSSASLLGRQVVSLAIIRFSHITALLNINILFYSMELLTVDCLVHLIFEWCYTEKNIHKR